MVKKQPKKKCTCNHCILEEEVLPLLAKAREICVAHNMVLIAGVNADKDEAVYVRSHPSHPTPWGQSGLSKPFPKTGVSATMLLTHFAHESMGQIDPFLRMLSESHLCPKGTRIVRVGLKKEPKKHATR